MGLISYRPEWRLLANQTDITATIRERLISLRYTDEAGIESDMLEIQLADHDPQHPLRLPPTGAELVLHLGYEGGLKKIGLFVADELELSGPPGVMTIRARAAPFDESKAGKSQLQTQKRRKWEAGKKLSDIVRTIAAEHKLQPVIAASMEHITLPQQDQIDESDINFLVRIGKKYDAIIKPAAGRLILAKAGESKSASGQKMPAVSLRPGDVSSWRMSLAKREHVGTVMAFWHATKAAKLNEVKVGSGEPVVRLKRYFPTEAMAMAATRSDLERRARRQATLSVTLPGRTDVVAEGQLVLAGFRDGVDGTWTVTRAEHSLDGSGYVTSVEAEWPTETAAAKAGTTAGATPAATPAGAAPAAKPANTPATHAGSKPGQPAASGPAPAAPPVTSVPAAPKPTAPPAA